MAKYWADSGSHIRGCLFPLLFLTGVSAHILQRQPLPAVHCYQVVCMCGTILEHHSACTWGHAPDNPENCPFGWVQFVSIQHLDGWNNLQRNVLHSWRCENWVTNFAQPRFGQGSRVDGLPIKYSTARASSLHFFGSCTNWIWFLLLPTLLSEFRPDSISLRD